MRRPPSPGWASALSQLSDFGASSVKRAVPAERREPVLELQQHLRVRPHPQLVDRLQALPAEPGPVQVDVAERGERQAQHDVVGDHGRGHTAEPELERPVAPFDHRLQRRLQVQRVGGEQVGEHVRDLIVAAADVVALVRRSARVRRDVRVEQRDRGRVLGVDPPEPREPDVDRPAQERRAPAGHVGVHPLAHRHPVERLRGRARLPPPVRTDLLRVTHQPADHHVEVLPNVVPIPERSVQDQQTLDVALLLVGGPQVVEVQAKGRDDAPELYVPGVDELAAVLGHLSAVERPRGPTAAADPIARLVQVRTDAVLLQLVRAANTGETRSHHDHARIVHAVSTWASQRRERRHRDRRGAPRTPAPCRRCRRLICCRPQVDRLIDRERAILGERRMHLGELAHRAHQRCPASHGPPPDRVGATSVER